MGQEKRYELCPTEGMDMYGSPEAWEAYVKVRDAALEQWLPDPDGPPADSALGS